MVHAIAITRVPGWEDAFPWAFAATAHRRPAAAGPDFALDPDAPGGGAIRHRDDWRRLLSQLGWRQIVVGRQVHGTEINLIRSDYSGVHLAGDCDGHATRRPGVLLAVTLADCVGVFLADPAHRAVALVHSGWRGTARGILGHGLGTMRSAFGTRAADLSVHLGPAICGDCYEVGAEVLDALGLRGRRTADLRAVLRDQARDAGVPQHAISISQHCTRCGDGRYYSHRAGDRGRHLALLGISSDTSGNTPPAA